MNTKPTTCTLPPDGYYCSRKPGHQGPCAAYPIAQLESEGHHHLTAEEYAAHAGEVAKAFRKGYDSPVEPVDMILYCPSCHFQHIDAPDERTPGWTNPPHRSHLCHVCGCIWRPADVPTNGVAGIKTKGKNDTLPLDALMVARFRAGAGKGVSEAWARLPAPTSYDGHGYTQEHRSALEGSGLKVSAVDFDPNQPPSRLAGVSPEVTSLLADFTKALQLANKIGMTRQENGYAINQIAVGQLVDLQISIEDRIKLLGGGMT